MTAILLRKRFAIGAKDLNPKVEKNRAMLRLNLQAEVEIMPEFQPQSQTSPVPIVGSIDATQVIQQNRPKLIRLHPYERMPMKIDSPLVPLPPAQVPPV